MQRRLFADVASLVALTIVGCGTDPQPSQGNTAGTNPGASGAGVGGQSAAGAATTAGNGGIATTGGTAGAGAGGTPTTAGSGGNGGGGNAPACKPVTALNGSGLTIAATDVSAFKFAAPPTVHISKMAYDPVGKLLVLINGDDGKMYSVDPHVDLPTAAMASPVTTSKAYEAGYTVPAGYGTGIYQPYRGLAFGPDGALYVMAAKAGGVAISKGPAPATPGGARTWTTLVSTSQAFTPSGTNYDHSFSGMAVSPDGMSLFFSSGSRTEHGEEEVGAREVPLSSAIFKVSTSTPTDLKNEEAALAPFLFADGTRNVFDQEFNANGDLIVTENGPDLDLPDEVNFIEQGKHYGFPWRFGNVDNPTRKAGFNYQNDTRARVNVYADIANRYKDDSAGFPMPPQGVTFTDPVVNHGPAGIALVADDKAQPSKAGAEGLPGVSAHRSPLGLAFDAKGALCGEYYKQGFMLSYGALPGGSIGDGEFGEDLLLLNMTKGGDGKYSMTAKALVSQGIKQPMDAALVGNRLFTIGQGDAAQLYVFVLPTP